MLTPATPAAPPTLEELDALLRLLDDETPSVRERVAERIARCGGDLSEWLATRSKPLNPHERKLLTAMLHPARRENLVRDWIAPTGGAAALQEDWESFEALLRTLSDFLHDGISLRQPLSDALDLLAEEAAEQGVSTADELRTFLFEGGRLVGNHKEYSDPRNSDLAWSIAEGRSNPLGLCLIFILVGRRLDLEIEGVNFPGHFICRIFEDGYPLIVDCFERGAVHPQSVLLDSPELGRSHKNLLSQTAAPGAILLRLLGNLCHAFKETGRSNDVLLVKELVSTLE